MDTDAFRKVGDLPISPRPLFPSSLAVNDGVVKLHYSKNYPQLEALTERDKTNFRDYNSDKNAVAAFTAKLDKSGCIRDWEQTSDFEGDSVHVMPTSSQTAVIRNGESLVFTRKAGPSKPIALGNSESQIQALAFWPNGKLGILLQGESGSMLGVLDTETGSASVSHFRTRNKSTLESAQPFAIYPSSWPTAAVAYEEKDACAYDSYDFASGEPSANWKHAFQSDKCWGRAAVNTSGDILLDAKGAVVSLASGKVEWIASLPEAYSFAIAPNSRWAMFCLGSSAQAWNLSRRDVIFNVFQEASPLQAISGSGKSVFINRPGQSGPYQHFFANFASISPDGRNILFVGNHRGLSSVWTCTAEDGLERFDDMPDYLTGGQWIDDSNIILWSDRELVLCDARTKSKTETHLTGSKADNYGALSAGYKYPFGTSFNKAKSILATHIKLLGICFWPESPETAVGPDRRAGKGGYAADLELWLGHALSKAMNWEAVLAEMSSSKILELATYTRIRVGDETERPTPPSSPVIRERLRALFPYLYFI